MSQIILTILGSGTCVPAPERVSSGYALQIRDRLIAFDFGTGALHRLMQAGLDYRNIDDIFFSHFHLDHINSLAPLIFALKHTPNYSHNKLLTLWGPSGLIDVYDQLSGVHNLGQLNWIRIKELDPGKKRFNYWAVEFAATQHGLRPSLGYRLETEEGTFVYSGDTEYCEAIVRLTQNADLALLECSFPDSMAAPFHLTPATAGRIAREAACNNLVLTHFYPVFGSIDPVTECQKVFPGKVYAAEDLMEIQLNQGNITIRKK